MFRTELGAGFSATRDISARNGAAYPKFPAYTGLSERKSENRWGETFTKTFDLTGHASIRQRNVQVDDGRAELAWARIAVRDVAGNGAFINPVRR